MQAVEHLGCSGAGRHLAGSSHHEVMHSTQPNGVKPRKRLRDKELSHDLSAKKERSSERKSGLNLVLSKGGGLADVASVERLAYMMQHEWINDGGRKTLDLISGRSALVAALACTQEVDLLKRFLKLGGLYLLDQWLQETSHIGRSALEGEDEACENLLLLLLQAIERMPADLLALRSCAVGKSVNHLRSHKHQEVQRRAKKVGEMWKKKRVSAEMKESSDTAMEPLNSFCSDAEMKPVQQKVILHTSGSNGVGGDSSCTVTLKFASVASLCSPCPPSENPPNKAPPFGTTSLPRVQSPDIASLRPEPYRTDVCKSPQLKGSNTGFRSHKRATKESNAREKKASLIRSNAPSTHSLSDTSASAPSGGSSMHTASKVNTPSDESSSPCRSTSQHPSSSPCRSDTQHTNSDSSNAVGSRSHATASAPSPNKTKDRKNHGNKKLRVLSCSPTGDLEDGEQRKKSRESSPIVTHITQDTKVTSGAIHPKRETVGITLLASIAASECSVSDVKVAESPLDLKSSKQIVSNEGQGKNWVGASQAKSRLAPRPHSMEQECAFHSPQEGSGLSTERGEHLDRNSSTMSSPPDARFACPVPEGKKAGIIYLKAPNPRDTACSQSSLLEKHPVSNISVPSLNTRRPDPSMTGSECEQSTDRGTSHQLRCTIETAGESSARDNSSFLHRASPQKSPSKTRASPSRFSVDDALEVARQVAIEVEQEMVSYQKYSSDKGTDRNSSLTCRASDSDRDGPPYVKVERCAEPASSEAHASVLSSGNAGHENPQNNLLLAGELCKQQAKSTGGSIVSCGEEAPLKPCHKEQVLYNTEIREGHREQTTESLGSISKQNGKFRPDFDLNEGLDVEECALQDSQPLTLPTSKLSSPPVGGFGPSAPIAVVAAMKGPFTPPAAPSRPAGEPGWKGSAATSAFRPTRPRRILEKATDASHSGGTHATKPLFDFDLNVAADQGVEEVHKLAVSSLSSPPTTLPSPIRGISQKASESVVRPWDLNCADLDCEGGTSENKSVQVASNGDVKSIKSTTMLDIDLNDGPMLPDKEDGLTACNVKALEMPYPCSSVIKVQPGTTNEGPNTYGRSCYPSTTFSGSTPSFDPPHGLVAAESLGMPAPNDMPFQYSFCRQGPAFTPPGIAYSSMHPGGYSYAAFPIGFTPPFQNFTMPFTSQAHSLPAVTGSYLSTEGLMPSQIRPPLVGVLDTTRPAGGSAVLGRTELDLNSNHQNMGVGIKNERSPSQPVTVMSNNWTEKTMTRHQFMDMSKWRETEACLGMQGPAFKHTMWQ